MIAFMTPEETGRLISRARKRRNMTQQDLADAAGVVVRTVVAWERGESVPRKNTGLVEDLLGISLSGEDEPGAPDPLVAEIRELAGRLSWTPAQQDAWAAVYEARKPPQERAG